MLVKNLRKYQNYKNPLWCRKSTLRLIAHCMRSWLCDWRDIIIIRRMPKYLYERERVPTPDVDLDIVCWSILSENPESFQRNFPDRRCLPTEKQKPHLQMTTTASVGFAPVADQGFITVQKLSEEHLLIVKWCSILCDNMITLIRL